MQFLSSITKPTKFFAALLVTTLFANSAYSDIIYDFKGTINSSGSEVYTVGQSVDLSITLSSQLPIQSFHPILGDPTSTRFLFDMTSATVTVNGTTFSLRQAGPGNPNVVATDISGVPTSYGFGSNWFLSDQESLKQVGFSFQTFLQEAVDSNSLPYSGFSLDTSGINGFGGIIQLFDKTQSIEPGFRNRFGTANITSYTVTDTTRVPDVNSTAVLLAISMFGLVALRRKFSHAWRS